MGNTKEAPMSHDIRSLGYPVDTKVHPAGGEWGQFKRVLAANPLPETRDALCAEVTRARAKFPGNRHLLAALTEEVGELAQAMLQGKPTAEIQREALQVACVALRIFEEGDASFAALSEEEKKT